MKSDQALRRCAAALHELSAEDREWVLGRLPEAEGVVISQLLEELQSLGVVEQVPVASPEPVWLAQALSLEPASLGASILRQLAPLQRTRVLVALTHRAREAVQSELVQAKPLAPALERAVREELRSRLASASPQRSFRLRAWGRSLLRLGAVEA